MPATDMLMGVAATATTALDGSAGGQDDKSTLRIRLQRLASFRMW